MALDTSRCNHLTPLFLKGQIIYLQPASYNEIRLTGHQYITPSHLVEVLHVLAKLKKTCSRMCR